MPIVFFENFEQDTSASILQRYPGSRRFLHGPDRVGFPIQRQLANTAVQYDGILEFDGVQVVPSRLELLLHFDDNGDITGVSASAGILVFYNNLRIFGISSNAIRFDHSPFSGTNWFKDITLPYPAKNIRAIQAVVDYVGRTLTVLIDGAVYLNKSPVESWVFTPNTNNNLFIDTGANAIQNQYFPNFLKSIVIGVDLPVGQMLDPSSVQFSTSELELGAQTNVEFSDQGYVEDVDKADPTVIAPSVWSEDEGHITYNVVPQSNTLAQRVYSAGRSEVNGYIQIGGPLGLTVQPGETQTTFKPVRNTGSDVQVLYSRTQPWVGNGLGMEWGGETSLISYAALSTAMGVTVGTAMAENTWLRVRLDGQEMYVAKTPLRNNLTWANLYALGLVYGTDDNGLFPSGTPVNQLRTIDISGRTFKVRLLKGSEEDPYGGPNGATDWAGAQLSEWSRVFYPICSALVASYTGPKLASYTEAVLGMGGTINGRSSWCQELVSTNTSLRLMRGATLAYTAGGISTSAGTDIGWRPVLVPVDV